MVERKKFLLYTKHKKGSFVEIEKNINIKDFSY